MPVNAAFKRLYSNRVDLPQQYPRGAVQCFSLDQKAFQLGQGLDSRAQSKLAPEKSVSGLSEGYGSCHFTTSGFKSKFLGT